MADPRIIRYDRFLPTKAERESFDCGNSELNEWLVRYAGQNMEEGNAVVYLLREERRVFGYYSLSVGTISRDEAISAVRRKAPEPVPAIRLGRMAVDRAAQGRTLGSRMLAHAIRKAQVAQEVIGARCLLVHCLTEAVTRFYLDRGFQQSPISPMTLMLPLADVSATLEVLGAGGNDQPGHDDYS